MATSLPIYHSEFVSHSNTLGNLAVLQLRTKFRGPAPSVPDLKKDIIDEALYLFKSLIFFKHYELKLFADIIRIDYKNLLNKLTNDIQSNWDVVNKVIDCALINHAVFALFMYIHLNTSDYQGIDKLGCVFSEADRVLVYLVLYILECLKKLQKCPTKLVGSKELSMMAVRHFDLPGDPDFPRDLNNLYAKPKTQAEMDSMRSYLTQLRQELGVRLLDKVYSGDNVPPSKKTMEE